VDQPGHEPLKQLPLAQHDHGLVPHTLRRVAEAVDRLPEPDQVDQQLGAAGEEEPADGEQGGERERSQGYIYEDCTFLSSAVIAGTISARSPMTA
jgi:hypothetical protein